MSSFLERESPSKKYLYISVSSIYRLHFKVQPPPEMCYPFKNFYVTQMHGVESTSLTCAPSDLEIIDVHSKWLGDHWRTQQVTWRSLTYTASDLEIIDVHSKWLGDHWRTHAASDLEIIDVHSKWLEIIDVHRKWLEIIDVHSKWLGYYDTHSKWLGNHWHI